MSDERDNIAAREATPAAIRGFARICLAENVSEVDRLDALTILAERRFLRVSNASDAVDDLERIVKITDDEINCILLNTLN